MSARQNEDKMSGAKSASGQLIYDLLQRAFPSETRERIAFDHLGVPPATLSKWTNGRQRISAEKGYRLTISRVLNQAGVIDADANLELWGAYDFLWAQDHHELRTAAPPRLALPYAVATEPLNTAQGSEDEYAPTLPLYIPNALTRAHHFSARKLPMLGRDEEFEIGLAFLKEPAGFRWMQVAGIGGQGKSRFALELVLRAKENSWEAGFIHPSDLQAFARSFATWTPNAPTLIVVDYIIGFEAEIGDVLSGLAVRFSDGPPVRFLIVERQRWDRGFNLNGKASEGLNTGPGGGIADWFVKLTRSFTGRVDLMERTQHEVPVIEMSQLSADQLVEIIHLWARENNAVIEMADHEIETALSRIDPNGRPLYAYFFAEALMAGYETHGWSREDLLAATLTRDQTHRWAAYFDGAPPSLGDEDAALELSVLATLSNGLDASNVEGLTGWPRPTSKVKTQALALVDAPLGVHVGGPGNVIGRLEPDVLGGWFALEWIRQAGTRAEWMVQSAWTLSPRETAATLLRFAQDLPRHPAMETALAIAPTSLDGERAYAEIASSLLVALRPQINKHQIRILPRIETAALEGDLKAISRLGFCYQYAVGLEEPDLERAFHWYKEGAVLGDGRSMAYLGHWFFSGVTGEPDHPLAFEWFNKGAAAGDGHAMGYVGVCHHNGIGTVKDQKEGVRWFKRGGEAGDGASLVYLGICYMDGMGVDQDDDQAFDAFSKANDLGSSHALAYLGQLYLQGRGVKKNEAMAIRFLEEGIANGSAAAHAFLGLCYRDGLGVEADLSRAMEHIQKGVEGRSGAALFFIGECYEHGIGVDQDFSKAVELWREAVRLGERSAKVRLIELDLWEEG